jgi:hypothetical protein
VSDSCPIPESRRERLFGVLNAELGEALRVGDLGAARAAHQALGRLLRDDGEPGEVVDLAAERAKRAQS